MSEPFVTGYYRFTDINFEWHQVLQNPSDKSALKAFLAPESLTHPDNPLNIHKKSKEPGITLTMGTMENGESRLLFSSKQIEYTRYWLHTVGFTEKLLPLPSARYLLTERSLKTASPVTYKSGTELKNALKEIQKNNKRLKGTDKTLLSLRDTFEKMRTCWAKKRGVWLAIDFEAWEMDHKVITEYGWSSITWQDGRELPAENGHYIIQENMKYTNSTYVPNNRDYFLFGDSQKIQKQALKTLIKEQISKYAREGPLYLVFHDYHQDVDYLKDIDAVDKVSYTLPDVAADHGIYVIDTSALFSALEGLVSERRPLDRLCALLRISDTDRFHNAGNDAHFTLLALKTMAEGPPLDLQRNSRWPGQTDTTLGSGKGVQVDWAPHQIDSDFDDMEGIFKTYTGPHDTDSEQGEA